MTDTTQGQDAPANAAPTEAPDVDDLFPKQDVDDLFPADYKPTNQPVRNVSPIQDMLFSNAGRAHARILDAFGYGFAQDWGAGQKEFSEADEALRKSGVWNDYAKGQRNIIKAANEAIMRPAVAALLAAKSTASGLFRGGQEAFVQAGTEVGMPSLAREISAIPEAFPAGVHQMAGVPHLPEPIAQAKSLDVIGAGEGGYFGTKPVEAETPAQQAEAAKVQDVAKAETLPGHQVDAAPSPVAQPAAAPIVEAPAAAEQPAQDIHAVARQIAPDTFREFDALSQKKDTFRRWIDDLREVRDQTARDNAPHAAEIAELQGKLEDATPRLAKKYNERLAPLVAERDAYVTEQTSRDSTDMAKIREQLMQTDYRMRDLAPDVSKAYREAEARIPQPVQAAPEPAAPQAVILAHDETPSQTAAAETVDARHDRITKELHDLPASADPQLRLALNDAGSIFGVSAGTDKAVSAPNSIEWSLKNNRPDIAETIVERAERAAANAREARPGVPENSPRFKPIEDRLAEDAKKQEEFAKELRKSIGDRLETPAAPEQPKIPIAHAPSIVASEVERLTAVGRPAEEAEAAAQVVAAYWETRASRFEGKKGTAAEMYAREAPDVVAGKERPAKRARELELAQRDREFDQAAPNEPRTHAIPDAAGDILSSYKDDKAIKADPNYKAAKAGDPEAAARLVTATVDPGTIEAAKERFGAGAIYAPVVAEEAQGHNAIPHLLAAHYAEETGGTVSTDIGQINKAFHTGAGPMERLANPAHFEGNVVPGGRYVIVDDVSVMGSTLASMADHIQKNGGEVVGVVTLANASRTGVLKPSRAHIADIERRYGNEVRDLFKTEPTALTADEAAYIRNFRDADALRAAADASEGKRNARLRSKGLGEAEGGQDLNQSINGRIRIREDARNTITMMAKADASTYVHETGHDWLDRMLRDARDPDAPEVLRNDAATVLKWLGVDSPDAVKTRHHEKFARGFETYMMEGRAPSTALAKVFAKFKDWLTTIYKTVSALKAPISDDIRGVFDRLLAEKPEKTVVAPETERPGGLAEKHEALAEGTPAERAHDVANTIEAERDSHAAANQLEKRDNDTRLANTGTEAEGRAAGGAQPPDHADAPRSAGGEAEAAGGVGALGGGGGEAAAQGRAAREKPKQQGSIGNVTAPTPLLRFIASKGGIKASDELIKDLQQVLGGKNRLVPGFGQLIRNPKQLSSSARKAGRSEAMSLDRAREAAIEAGHLPEGASITDLLNAIDDEVRGIGHGNERPTDPAELAHAEHSFVETLNDHLKAAGGFELSDAERARALELWRHEGLNEPADIIERLALEADDDAIEHGAPAGPGVPGWDVPAPGWDVFDERAGASGAGGTAEGVGPGQPGGHAARAGGEAQKPVDATTDLPRSETQLVDKAGNIRLDNLGTPEDVNAVIRATAQELEPYNEAITRGRVSDAEVLKLADALGMTPEMISERKLGQAFNAEQIVAARKLLIQSAGNVRDLAAKIAGGTEADVLAYAQARARHLMIQEQVSGITAEAGRALRAFRDLGGSKEAAELSEFLKATQGKTLYQMKEEGALLAMMGTPQQVSKAVHEASLTRWQKFRSGILSWFINNLISGPITHAGYSIGNNVVQLFKATVDTPVAAAMSALRDLPPEERVYFGEVGAQLYGMVRGMRDGYSPALTALKTGVPYMKGDIDALVGQIEAAHRPQAIPGKLGYVMETPSRAVTAIHTMHYSMNYEAEIARRGFRAAMKDGLDPGSDAFNRKVAEFTQSPPAAEMEAAHDEAMKMVLMKSAQFGTAQYHLQKAVNSNILAKIVMPFMQVGSNILHESFIERTPLAFASQAVRDNLMGKNGEVARQTQASRIAVGIGVSTAVIGLTAEGILTGGGPSDPKQLAVKEMTGWRPYSIKVGEAYVPYRKYLGGLGPLIAGTADMYEVGHALNEEGLTKAAASSLFGFAEVIADESWAKGLSNFIDAARHWDRDGGRYLRNLAADFIPFSIGLSQVTNLTDPYRREVRSMLDVARAHVPGLSRGLYPVRDIWGEPIESHTALGPSTANHDPATQALLDAGYYPGKLERKIRGVELSDQQYDDFTRMAGRMARMRVNALANTPGIAQLPKQVRADKIKDIIESSRESARSMILMQNPEIVTKASAAKTARLHGAIVH